MSPNSLRDKFLSKTWTRDGFIVSTDPSLISLSSLNKAFDGPAMYWASSLSEEALKDMIDNSLCFGLYTPTPVPHTDSSTHTSQPQSTSLSPPTPDARPSTAMSETGQGPSQIGFARCITDYVTFLYLTDVYVLDEWQGEGLGSWIIQCVQEVIETMPHLRGSMLVTSNHSASGRGLYERRMGMRRIGEDARRGSIVERLGRMGSPAAEEDGHDLIVMRAQGPAGAF